MRLRHPRAGAADGRRFAGADRRRRPRHPPGRLGVDAHGRRRRQPLAALDAVPADARRVAGVERRSHGDGAVRAHRRAAGAADEGSEHLLLLPRSSGAGIAVPPRRRHDLGHQHRARHRLGHAADREGRGDLRQVAERQGVRADHRRPGVERRGGAIAEARPHQRRPGLRGRRRHERRRLHPRAGAPAERHDAARTADPFVARPPVAVDDRECRRRRIPGDRSRRRPRNRQPDHRRARRRAGSRGLEVDERGALLALPARGRSVHRHRAAVPAGARRALAAGRRRGAALASCGR